MTHEYTLLLGGLVLPGGGHPDGTALAYAHDTILAVGSDADVRAISRGDSRFVDLAGRAVLPADGDGPLEPGAPASFDVVDAAAVTVAAVRDGRLVKGGLPGLG